MIPKQLKLAHETVQRIQQFDVHENERCWVEVDCGSFIVREIIIDGRNVLEEAEGREQQDE